MHGTLSNPGNGPIWGLFWTAIACATGCFLIPVAALYWDGIQMEATLPDLIPPAAGTSHGPRTVAAAFHVDLPFGLEPQELFGFGLLFVGVSAIAWVRILAVMAPRFRRRAVDRQRGL